MKDPLGGISVKSKLALMFLSLCAVTFGLGGMLVSQSTADTLESEILQRLGYQCRAYAMALEARLSTLMRRAEDFASDGYIRDHVAAMQSVGDADRARWREPLRRHLGLNKLPLEPAFADLALADGDGRVLLAVHDVDAPSLAAEARRSVARPGSTHGGLLASPGAGGDGWPETELILATPLRDLDGGRELGRLLARVRLEAWVAEALTAARDDGGRADLDVHLTLHDGAGRALIVPPSYPAGAPGERLRVIDAPTAPGPADVDYAPVRGTYSQTFPVGAAGWRLEVRLSSEKALLPIAGMQSRLLGGGLLLAGLSLLLLYFPMRFLARPLVLMKEAAGRIRGGDYAARVAVESSDEIGELAQSFNQMAEGLAERNQRLEAGARDLREQRRVAAEERDRLDAVIASMHDGLVVLDPSGAVVLSNRSAEPLLEMLRRGDIHAARAAGAAGAAATGRHLCHESPRGERDCLACLLDPRGPERSCVVEVGPRVFEVHTTDLAPDDQGHTGRVLVARDISDRVAQDERQIHQERLAVLGEVAAVMAHELNNPLASISMFNQMLAEDLEAGSPLQENVEVIRRNTEACKRTIRELLDYATGATPEVGPLDLHDTLRDVARFLRPLAERAGVELRTELQARAPEVHGDEVQLRQVFMNLVMNALQAVRDVGPGSDGVRPGGRVTLTTRDEDGELAVDVADSGPGIPADVREQVFRPFFTTKPRGTGTGLGLPTARRIAELHGGSLELAESSPAGTVFRVRLRSRAPGSAGDRSGARAAGRAAGPTAEARP